MSREKSERNQAIYQDYKDGMKEIMLVEKYRLTSTRIWQIINRQKEKEKNAEKKR